MKKKRNLIINIALVAMLILGIAIMAYPTVSDLWNKSRQTRAIAMYDKAVDEMDSNNKELLLEKARKYNYDLSKLNSPLSDYESVSGYEDVLDITGTGIMGYIEIPRINTRLPIYHGTSPEVLNIAVGHLQGSSLPIGGIGNHSVISAHRGLPSAKLFTDLDKLTENDTFRITVLDEIMDYEVDEINVVLPSETDKLEIIPDMDCVTLMTCTPYGINSHRLLVRAHRIETDMPLNVKVSADAVTVDDISVIPFIALPIITGLILFWIITGKHDKKSKR